MRDKSDRLGRALEFCQPQEAKELEAHYFGGTVELDEYGFLKIEGYLFRTRAEAQAEILGRLQRKRIFTTFVLGEFRGELRFSNRQRWRGFPVEIEQYPGSQKKRKRRVGTATGRP